MYILIYVLLHLIHVLLYDLVFRPIQGIFIL